MARVPKPKCPTALDLEHLVTALHEDTVPNAMHPLCREGTGRALVKTLETVVAFPETAKRLLDLWAAKYGA